MAAQSIAMSATKISKYSNSRIRSTFPRGLAREIEIYDREVKHIGYAIRCADSGIALEITTGPDIDVSTMNVVAPIVHKTGQVELELPVFQMEAWNLVDTQIDWPEPEELNVQEDGSVTILAPILGWEPKYDVDMFGASAGFPHRSSISMSGDKRQNIESAFPINPAEEIGLTETDTRAEITFDCVDGRKVLVATPTEEGRTELRNSVSVHLAGAGKRQARFNAARIAAEFDVREVLEVESVRLRWLNQNGQLIGFVHEGEREQ